MFEFMWGGERGCWICAGSLWGNLVDLLCLCNAHGQHNKMKMEKYGAAILQRLRNIQMFAWEIFFSMTSYQFFTLGGFCVP